MTSHLGHFLYWMDQTVPESKTTSCCVQFRQVVIELCVGYFLPAQNDEMDTMKYVGPFGRLLFGYGYGAEPMKLDKGELARRIFFSGTTYHFSSPGCSIWLGDARKNERT